MNNRTFLGYKPARAMTDDRPWSGGKTCFSTSFANPAPPVLHYFFVRCSGIILMWLCFCSRFFWQLSDRLVDQFSLQLLGNPRGLSQVLRYFLVSERVRIFIDIFGLMILPAVDVKLGEENLDLGKAPHKPETPLTWLPLGSWAWTAQKSRPCQARMVRSSLPQNLFRLFDQHRKTPHH